MIKTTLFISLLMLAACHKPDARCAFVCTEQEVEAGTCLGHPELNQCSWQGEILYCSNLCEIITIP